ncbi:MAG: peptidase T, partial [Kiritimatiellia bacterium]
MLKTFLDYIRMETTSDEASETTPSSCVQFALAHRVAEDLRTCGVVQVVETPQCYVYATIPASPGQSKIPPLGFVAHLDTSPEVSGKNVRPCIIEKYDGKPLPLGSSGVVLSPALCPELAGMIGKTLITTDGTTLLGGDDKAGVAILVQLARTLSASDAPPHPELHLAFTPDEEIGRGTIAFDPALFVARYAYTVDGSTPNVFECATFNAAAATFSFTGINTHPGS